MMKRLSVLVALVVLPLSLIWADVVHAQSVRANLRVLEQAVADEPRPIEGLSAKDQCYLKGWVAKIDAAGDYENLYGPNQGAFDINKILMGHTLEAALNIADKQYREAFIYIESNYNDTKANEFGDVVSRALDSLISNPPVCAPSPTPQPDE